MRGHLGLVAIAAAIPATVASVSATQARGRHRHHPSLSACVVNVPKGARVHPHRRHRGPAPCRLRTGHAVRGGPIAVLHTTIKSSGLPQGATPSGHDPVALSLPAGPYRQPHPGPPASFSAGSGAAARSASHPPALGGLQLYDSQSVQYSNYTGHGSPLTPLVGGFDPSAADGSGVLFYASASDDAYSTNVLDSLPGSASFAEVNPATALAPEPGGMTFCCHQIVRYVPPNPQDPQAGDFFVWVLQYSDNAGDTGANLLRVAVATPVQVASGQWSFFDLSGDLVHHTGAYLDTPDVEVGQNHVYLTFNIFDASGRSQGATVMRFLLGELGAIANGAAQGLPYYEFYNDPVTEGLRVAQSPTPDSVTFLVSEKDDSTLRLYEWDEGPSDHIFYGDVGIRTIGKSGLGLPSNQWLGWLNGSPADQRIRAVTTTDVLWPHLLVAFQGGADSPFPQPQIGVSDIDVDFTNTGEFTLFNQSYVWSPTQAIGQPEMASNAYGDVVLSYWHNTAAGVEHGIGAIEPNLSHPSAPPLEALGPDTTTGANSAGGADFTSLGVSYINSASSDQFPCFSDAEWTGTPSSATATWETFGVPGIGAVCPTQGPSSPRQPVPTIGQPLQTSLTLTCPDSVHAGQQIAVTGTLSYSAAPGGGVGGRTVVVTYAGGATAHTLVTDVNGNFTDEATAGSPPSWTIQASFAGDPFTEPATSTTCSVPVDGTP